MSRPNQLDPQARCSFGPAPLLPCVRVPMQMKHGEHRNEVGVHGEEHAVRKIANECPPSAFLDRRKQKGTVEEPREHRIDLSLKTEAQASALALVPKGRLENIELSLGRDIEPPHLASGAEAGQKLVADLRPGAGGHLASPVRREALGHDLAMPVRNRHVFRMLREMSPQPLNVFELLIRRELVEASRRKGRLRHVPSIPPAHSTAGLANVTISTLGVRREDTPDATPNRRPVRQTWRPQFHIMYVSVNAIQPGLRTRTKDAIGTIRHIFLEADHDGPRLLAQIGGHDDLPPTSNVLETSPGRVHVFWRAEGFTPDGAARLQKHLAHDLATDEAATSCSQTTRLPGYRNHKTRLRVSSPSAITTPPPVSVLVPFPARANPDQSRRSSATSDRTCRIWSNAPVAIWVEWRAEGLLRECSACTARRVGRAHRRRSMVGHHGADEPVRAGTISEYGSRVEVSHGPLPADSTERAAAAVRSSHRTLWRVLPVPARGVGCARSG